LGGALDNPLSSQTGEAGNYEENEETVPRLTWPVLTRRDASLINKLAQLGWQSMRAL